MARPILYVDASDIAPGALDEVKVLMTDLAKFVEENEPQLISYAFYLDEAEGRMTTVAVHPDSASLEFHMDIGGERFARFAGLITLQAIDVFGPVSAAVVELLVGKARMLGTGTVRVHHMHAGYSDRTRTKA